MIDMQGLSWWEYAIAAVVCVGIPAFIVLHIAFHLIGW